MTHAERLREMALAHDEDGDAALAGADAIDENEALKARLRELEARTAKLRDLAIMGKNGLDDALRLIAELRGLNGVSGSYEIGSGR